MSVGDGRRADRVNRVVLSVLGALMLIGGAVGLAYSLGAFGKERSQWPLFAVRPAARLDERQPRLVLDRRDRSPA